MTAQETQVALYYMRRNTKRRSSAFAAVPAYAVGDWSATAANPITLAVTGTVLSAVQYRGSLAGAAWGTPADLPLSGGTGATGLAHSDGAYRLQIRAVSGNEPGEWSDVKPV